MSHAMYPRVYKLNRHLFNNLIQHQLHLTLNALTF